MQGLEAGYFHSSEEVSYLRREEKRIPFYISLSHGTKLYFIKLIEFNEILTLIKNIYIKILILIKKKRKIKILIKKNYTLCDVSSQSFKD